MGTYPQQSRNGASKLACARKSGLLTGRTISSRQVAGRGQAVRKGRLILSRMTIFPLYFAPPILVLFSIFAPLPPGQAQPTVRNQ